MPSSSRTTDFFVRTVKLSDGSIVCNVACIPLGETEYVDIHYAVNYDRAAQLAITLNQAMATA